MVWTVFDFNPVLSGITNTISPDNTSTCKFGVGQLISGNKVDLNVDNNVPLLYRNGQVGAQSGLRYQWQSSTDNVNWVNIDGATAQSYLPTSQEVTTYYRRQIFYAYPGCTTPLSTSNVATVTVSSNIAPSVSVPVSAYTTCSGTPVNLELDISNNNGGSPTYNVVWDNSTNTLSNMTLNGTIAKATATAATNTVYTAKITDNTSGCVQFGQVQVMAYSAGADQTSISKCGDNAVLIGNLPSAAGVAGVTYSWSPSLGLDCATCPQTNASTAGTYQLTMTVPVTSGGTCTSNMTSTVVAITAPATADFAGPDVTLCSPANSTVDVSAKIGSSNPADWSYSYTWSPGSYLSSNQSYRPTVQLGSLLPSPNPITYYLTATKGGCSFVDSMKLSVLRADAGIDGCGPRMIGNMTDPTPGIKNKTYKWEALDIGDGYATFQPSSSTTSQVAYVTAATNTTRFQLTVTDPATGATCSAIVSVPNCGCLNTSIDVLGGVGCPKFSNGKPVIQMQATIPGYVDNGNLVYDWSPKVGLDRYDSSIVTLTDGTSRTYTVSIKDKFSGQEICSVSREVNGIGWSFPVFNAPDKKVCLPSTGSNDISIGLLPGNTNYTYQWDGTGLTGATSSNPTVSVGPTYTSQSYPVTITENGSGCITHDTVNVTVVPTVVNAGPDIVVCGSAITELAQGVDSLNGYTYQWNAVLPQGTPDPTQWINGTDNTWLHAKIIVGGDITYTLTATNTITGCSATDEVQVQTNKPSVITITGANSICKGSSVTLTAPLYAGAVYTWASSDPTEQMPSGTELNSINVTPKKNVTYTLSVTFGGSCGISTGTMSVSVKDLSYIPTDHGVYCPSTNPNTLTLGPSTDPAGGVVPYTFSWSPANLVVNPNSRQTTPSVAPTVTTNYNLTITDANGCSATTTETVVVDASSKPNAGPDRNMCPNTTEMLGDASNTNVTWYAVATSLANTSQLSSTTIGNPVFTPTGVGIYKFYVEYNTGCVNPDTVVIVVRDNPALSASSATFCKGAGSFATIGTSAVAGVSYQWYPATGLDNPTASQTIVRTTTSTVYTLTATDQYGCQTTVNVPVLVSGNAPAITVPDLTLCFGVSSMQFVPQVTPAGGNYTYQWSPAAGLSNTNIASPYVMPSDMGNTNTYALTVTDQATGCFAQASAVAKTIDCTKPLPVTFLYFNGVAQNGKAVLSWATGTELNSSYYEVQRSSEGLSWIVIGKVKATNNPVGSKYGFVDNGAPQGKAYYRLKEVDIDGDYMYSATKELNFGNSNATAKTVSWYPNPTTGQIKLKTSGKTITMLTLTDMSGRIVYQQTNVAEGTITLPVSLKTGLYIISFRMEGNIQSDKLMLLK